MVTMFFKEREREQFRFAESDDCREVCSFKCERERNCRTVIQWVIIVIGESVKCTFNV